MLSTMPNTTKNSTTTKHAVRLTFDKAASRMILIAALLVMLLIALFSLPDLATTHLPSLGLLLGAIVITALLSILLFKISAPSLNSMSAWESAAFAFTMLMLITIGTFLTIGFAGHHYGLVETQSVEIYLLRLVQVLVTSAVCYVLILRLLYLQGVENSAHKDSRSANLQALQSRIRPHFMFNSMNSIASLIRQSPADAEHALLDLADLIRVQMADARKLVPLTAETDTCKQYLAIEKLRLGDRLEVRWQIDDMPHGCQIPSLTLQPLLENAVYHGIEPNFGGGMIDIHYRYKNNKIYVSIRNPVPEIGDAPHRKGNKIAMQNIRERLARHFGKGASLSAETRAGIYCTRLCIPVVTG
jgi:two-component system, LytTR family, sensor histidine kinase AlgZ